MEYALHESRGGFLVFRNAIVRIAAILELVDFCLGHFAHQRIGHVARLALAHRACRERAGSDLNEEDQAAETLAFEECHSFREHADGRTNDVEGIGAHLALAPQIRLIGAARDDDQPVDTARGEECIPARLTDGTVRCLPVNFGNVVTYYADAACTTVLPVA